MMKTKEKKNVLNKQRRGKIFHLLEQQRDFQIKFFHTLKHHLAGLNSRVGLTLPGDW